MLMYPGKPERSSGIASMRLSGDVILQSSRLLPVDGQFSLDAALVQNVHVTRVAHRMVEAQSQAGIFRRRFMATDR